MLAVPISDTQTMTKATTHFSDINGRNGQGKIPEIYFIVIIRAILKKKMGIEKELLKFGQNPLNLMQQAKDLLTKLE